jgi:hypothetical protein
MSTPCKLLGKPTRHRGDGQAVVDMCFIGRVCDFSLGSGLRGKNIE